jgi:hypothetical protein
MIDCPNGDIRDLLPDFVHGRLGAVERERVEAHVATCEPCQDEVSLLRDLRATMRRVPAVDANAIAAAIPPYRVPVRRTWTSWRAAAAIATIAIGGTSIAIANRQPTVPHSVLVAKGSTGQTSQPTSSVPSVPSIPSTQPADPAVAPRDSVAASNSRTPIAEQPTRELAMGSGTVGDLSDRELKALLNDIETLDALPSADVETALPVTPLAPTEGAR